MITFTILFGKYGKDRKHGIVQSFLVYQITVNISFSKRYVNRTKLL